MNNVISFGVIVAFMIYIRLFTNPLNQISQAMTNLQSVAASSERIFEFLDEEEMSDESHVSKTLKRSNVKGEIEFKNVKFGYNPSKTIIKEAFMPFMIFMMLVCGTGSAINHKLNLYLIQTI